MKIRNPLLIKAAGAMGAIGVRALVGTNRFHFRYADPTVNPAEAASPEIQIPLTSQVGWY